MSEPVTSDSAEYEMTFFGILNAQGQFWTPMPFDSEAAAQARMDKFKGAHLERTHKIVPVRIQLTVIEPAS
jgi:hypothetical protein